MADYFIQTVPFKVPLFGSKAVDFGALCFFLCQKSDELTDRLHAIVSKISEVRFNIGRLFSGNDFRMELGCKLTAEGDLEEEEIRLANELGTAFLDMMAKELNKQPFMRTGFGHFKMPENWKYGCHFIYGKDPSAGYIMYTC